jgi:hypothetical protein
MDTSDEFPFAIPLSQIPQSQLPHPQIASANDWAQHTPGPPPQFPLFEDTGQPNQPGNPDSNPSDDSDEEAPNDLMIELNPLIQETRPTTSVPAAPTSRIPDLRRIRNSPNRTRLRAQPRREEPSLRRTLFGQQVRQEESAANQAANWQKKLEVFKIWSQVDNLDDFLVRVGSPLAYQLVLIWADIFVWCGRYIHIIPIREWHAYCCLGQRIYCMYLFRTTAPFLRLTVALSMLAFIVGFSTFLISCIDYTAIAPKKTLHDVLRPQCVKK